MSKGNRSNGGRWAVAGLCAVALPLQAEEARQPEVVVTATRTEVAREEALAAIAVIDRAQIEASGAQDVVALLRGQAGIDIVRAGGLGQQTAVFLRGSNTSHVLVLVDGVRVASANTGAYAWEQLPVAQIERIEIVRGPRAALFGSDAIGGVIQIFTRRAGGPSAAVGAASHDTLSAEAGYGRRDADGGFGLHAAWVDSGGFNARTPGAFGFDPDRDGFRQRSLRADGEFVGEAARISGRALASDATVEFDQGVSDVEQRTLDLRLDGGAEAPWSIALGAAREDLDTPAFFNRFESRRLQLDAQRSHRFGARGEWVYGVAAVNDRGASIDTFSDAAQYAESRRQRAAFASLRDGAGAFDWQLGARHDRYDSFGGETTLQAAFGWRIDGGPRLRASAGEGFRAPTLNELYSPGFGGLFAGNPDLRPERSRAVELGADWQGEAVDVSLSAYRNRVRDLVDFSGGDVFRAINIKRADLRGVELDAAADAGDWRLVARLGWQQARDADTEVALLRRADRKAMLGAERELADGRFGVALDGVSARPEFGGALPGHALLALWWRRPLSEAWRLDLRVDNALDRNYQLLRGYATAGRTYSLALRWQP